jgi:acetolactate synthase-1/2/3 large subunit
LENAIELATTGRKGPVLIDIPMDYQRSEIQQKIPIEKSPSKPVDVTKIDKFNADLSSALAESKRPLIIAGGGISSAIQTAEFREFVLSRNIPVVRTLMGLDALPTTSRLNVGFLGSYGNRWANLAIADADLLLVMGSRLDIRQTGSDVNGFLGNRKVFQVDIDAAEIDYRVTTSKSLNCSLTDYLKFSLNHHFTFNNEKLNIWLQHIEQIKMKYPHNFENIPQTGINPNSAIEKISKEWQDVGTFVTDVGQHQMWVAQSLQLNDHQRCLTSGGMGAMGFGLPAAIGAAFNDKSAPVCLFAGDGGLQLNIQELETLKRNNLNIRIIVLDNKTHGMVRQFQETYFNGRYGSTLDGYSAPNFAKIAHAYGIESLEIGDDEELTQAINRYRDFQGPLLLCLKIETFLNVYPKLAFGKNFGDMEPQVKSSEMEGT